MKIGLNTHIWNPCNIYGCTIGNNCVIGAFVEIQSDVVIGDNCKIESGAYLPTGVIIQDDVFIGPRVVFTNDKYPSAVNKDGTLKNKSDWECMKTYVCKGASIGANSTILPGVIIGNYAVVGAGSVVTKDVLPNTLVVGNPARKIVVK